MEWYQETIIRLLIEAMERKGCHVAVSYAAPSAKYHMRGLIFTYNNKEVFVHKDDIEDAMWAAYRIDWEPEAIVKRFERYLIDLHNKRQTYEDMGVNVK